VLTFETRDSDYNIGTNPIKGQKKKNIFYKKHLRDEITKTNAIKKDPKQNKQQ
jgi:hypothetical protein